MRINRFLSALTALVFAAFVLTGGWLGWVYQASERYLADVAPGPAFDYPASTDPAVIEQGQHIARTRGCFGCHGKQLEGRSWAEEWPEVGVPVAPNLARFAREHEPAVLEAALRQGIGHQGKALWSMPSYNFVHLSDADVAALISFLRSAPVVDSTLPEPGLSWGVRIDMARGRAQHMADWAGAVPFRVFHGRRTDGPAGFSAHADRLPGRQRCRVAEAAVKNPVKPCAKRCDDARFVTCFPEH